LSFENVKELYISFKNVTQRRSSQGLPLTKSQLKETDFFRNNQERFFLKNNPIFIFASNYFSPSTKMLGDFKQPKLSAFS